MKFLKRMPDNYRSLIISFLTGLSWFGIGMVITEIGTEPNTMAHSMHTFVTLLSSVAVMVCVYVVLQVFYND
jgi:hypothetical protein